ncbi:MAG TPA: methyl-accepting chemotaxis protein [Candidatus Sulfotelmatobacter sp.]|nr:methyl-accepting chemotaxis protein [Candidatus Sulfotelmatobacter sp.]
MGTIALVPVVRMELDSSVRGEVAAPALALLAAHLRELANPQHVVDLTRTFAPPPGAGPLEAEAFAALDAFVARVHGVLAAICRSSNDASRAAAENAFLLRRIAEVTERQADETAQLATAVHQTAQAAAVVAESSDATRSLTDELQRFAATSFETMDRSLERLGELRAHAQQAVADVAVVVEHAGQIELMLDVIDDVSVRTNLLAINAAIEAAHAGEHGRGFSVVADEIKKLADSTRSSTRAIAQLVRDVRAAVGSAHEATTHSAGETAAVTSDSAAVREDLTRMGSVVLEASSQIAAIAAAVDEQSATLHQVSRNVATLNQHGEESAAHAARARGLVLGEINAAIFGLAGGFALGTFFDRVRGWGDAFAAEVEHVLADALARGHAQRAQLLDDTYEPLTGALVRTLARLFDVTRAGAGFDPPKYRTAGDQLVDEALAPVCDAWAACDPRLVFASVTDLNGFAVMTSRALRCDWTGERALDLAGNRVKRIFEDPIGLGAARAGLGATGVPKRARRADFARHGIDLRRPAGPRGFALQTYARDTGVILNDLAVPVYLGEDRFGCVRIGYESSEGLSETKELSD